MISKFEKGQQVRIISSPFADTQHYVGCVGVVVYVEEMGAPVNDCVAEVHVEKKGTLCCARTMCEPVVLAAVITEEEPEPKHDYCGHPDCTDCFPPRLRKPTEESIAADLQRVVRDLFEKQRPSPAEASAIALKLLIEAVEEYYPNVRVVSANIDAITRKTTFVVEVPRWLADALDMK